MTLLMPRLPEIADPVRQPYPSDLSDAEWEILNPLYPSIKGLDIQWKSISGRFLTVSSMYSERGVDGK